MELTIFLEIAVRQFSRYHKYSIGTELRAISRKMINLIIKANSQHQKRNCLENLRDEAEQMKTEILIAKEIQAFKNFKQFEKAAELAVDICRQSEGWLKSQRA